MADTTLSESAAKAWILTADGALKAWLSRHTMDGPEAVGRYVALACAQLVDRGAWVDASANFFPDGAGCSPEQSGEHARAVAQAQGPRAVKAVDKALRGMLAADAREALLVSTLYGGGKVLTLTIADAPAAADHTVGGATDGATGDATGDASDMPPEIAEQLRKMREGGG